MREVALFPYDDFYLYIIYHKKMGRRMAHLVNRNDRSIRKTTAYARYLLEVSLGRFLSKDETVDHINEDKLDDRLGNLQILSALDNKAKSQKKRVYILYTCPFCKKEFTRRLGASYGVKEPACSRSCSTKYSFLKGRIAQR